ncbi:hypothetical protein HAX54_027510, partial [Datura stramonium]|nr:hypothetical protein [Datura stramonium]
ANNGVVLWSVGCCVVVVPLVTIRRETETGEGEGGEKKLGVLVRGVFVLRLEMVGSGSRGCGWLSIRWRRLSDGLVSPKM